MCPHELTSGILCIMQVCCTNKVHYLAHQQAIIRFYIQVFYLETWKAVTVHHHKECYDGGQAEAAYGQHRG